MSELINQMKLCSLCSSSEHWPYTEAKAFLHKRDGLHSTLGASWAPLKGHEKYEQHLRSLELLKL